MLDEYWLDRKLSDNDLHIPRMKFHDHAHETLELPFNSGTSFCWCSSLKVFQQLHDHYDTLFCCAIQFLIVDWVRCLAPTKPALFDMASLYLRIG